MRHPLDALKVYDPRAIARYYSRRPWLGVWRALVVTCSFIGLVIGVKLDDWLNRPPAASLLRAAQLRRVLTRLGPTFIKVGQALSTRPDLVRRDYLNELIKLQDQLPPYPTHRALAIVEAELGQPVHTLYQDFPSSPVAAASLGQVYKATLPTGEVVAVKVQRPNLLPKITLDLYVLRWAAGWIAPWLPLNLGFDLQLIVDEFGTKLFEEIDYLHEGQNAEKFAVNFAGDPQVKIPEIYWSHSSTHVLTLEWIDGLKLTDTARIQQANLDTDTLIEVGVTAGLRQLLEHGFFHADPHPGNLFALQDGRMAYIDFGMMDQLRQGTKETLVDAVVHLINKDYSDLAVDFVKLGFLSPETNIQPIIPALETVFDSAIGESVRDFNFKTITDQFSELMYQYPFRVPAKFALIIRSLVTQEGLALSLNPDFRIVEVAYPYVARRLLSEESPAFRRRLLQVLFKDGKFQWHRLENLISIARTSSNFDLLPTARMGASFLLSDEGTALRRQVLLALVEDDRLHTEEVQRLWDLVKEDLQPNRLLGAAVQAIAQYSTARAAAILPAVPDLAAVTQKPE
ncbi:MAG: AarF/ABC1/UbiB kinase family protein [Cyanobacteria bacterium P01_A01_bin.135]